MSAPVASPTIRPVEPDRDAEIAAILGLAPADVAAARDEAGGAVLAIEVDGVLAGAYLLRKDGMANAVSRIAIAEGYRRRGLGRMCLHDALLRSGKRPVVVDCDETCFPFFRAIGFKLVSKRKAIDGSVHFRLGWHAPRPKAPGEPPGVGNC